MKFVGNTHLIQGGKGALLQLRAALSKEGIVLEGNPDAFVREYAHFGIDEARELKERASARPLRSERRIFVVVAPHMTAEAQNALLKTIEEPTADAWFFFIVRSPDSLLSTVRSRAQRVDLESSEASARVDGDAFLSSEVPARLKMLEGLLEKGHDERRDLSEILTFLSSLEGTLQGAPVEARGEALEALYRARKYILDKGALVKPLMEQVALLVPKM